MRIIRLPAYHLKNCGAGMGSCIQKVTGALTGVAADQRDVKGKIQIWNFMMTVIETA
jgi:hypothetical protein